MFLKNHLAITVAGTVPDFHGLHCRKRMSINRWC